MHKEPTEQVHQTNLDRCLYCTFFQALGCGGSTRFCTFKNVFLIHDPACEKECSDRREAE
ncbi:MAG: hypothetical protein C4532_19395 [Candidatus Abyssobacteria bacterium SURF_17]|uniref:Uncharacterized protein n=1 Tax=Candidatus Abyssobacteria bacterium SURF_17 TaxID=2093361 RepID=A0A419ENN4_9BACT|nr:MAG: hypothetical protein C4532_19395 [Candidatus Abyssubacteria bacterium SURF_17]